MASVLLLAVAVPTSAQAAQGSLYVNGRAYQNPSGCLNISNEPGDLEIRNLLQGNVVTVWDGPNCTGDQTGEVGPGDGQDLYGASIKIEE
ncbi:hypothetical protein OG204_15145 [Streptomyces sp. NBC_01387]|uniref:hypothetical protein n=1 Tax=Streptomyces sp. NBC_01387 TaxID=2903849 RepID=UPI00325435B4